MDTFLDGFSNTLTYPMQTLVVNNVSYYNGGRGIHVFRSSNVTVANNTVFNNLTDACITTNAWSPGELSQQGGANNLWLNNLSKPVQTAKSNTCSLLAGNGGGVIDTNDTYYNNVLGTPESTGSVAPLVHSCIYNNDAAYFSCSNNKCNTDPGWVSATAGVASNSSGSPIGGTWIPGTVNFALQSTSPAVGYVLPIGWFLPSQDNANAGACHQSLTTCPNPGTTNY
jgi:parallel beta-helix repeat protein